MTITDIITGIAAAIAAGTITALVYVFAPVVRNARARLRRAR